MLFKVKRNGKGSPIIAEAIQLEDKQGKKHPKPQRHLVKNAFFPLRFSIMQWIGGNDCLLWNVVQIIKAPEEN
jgi:hypothetical protein